MRPAIVAVHFSIIRALHAVRRNGTYRKHTVLLKHNVEQMQKDTKLSFIFKFYLYIFINILLS